MEQRRNDAAVKDARIFPSKEECVSGMEQRRNYAAVRMHKSSQARRSVHQARGKDQTMQQ